LSYARMLRGGGAAPAYLLQASSRDVSGGRRRIRAVA